MVVKNLLHVHPPNQMCPHQLRLCVVSPEHMLGRKLCMPLQTVTLKMGEPLGWKVRDVFNLIRT